MCTFSTGDTNEVPCSALCYSPNPTPSIKPTPRCSLSTGDTTEVPCSVLCYTLKLYPIPHLRTYPAANGACCWRWTLEWNFLIRNCAVLCLFSHLGSRVSLVTPNNPLTAFITPLTNILPFHWFRVRHITCLSFTRNGCRVLVQRLSHGMQYLVVFFNHLEPNQLCICLSEMSRRTLRVPRW